MIVVLDQSATEDQVAEVFAELHRLGLEGRLLESGEKPVVHVTRGHTKRARKLLSLAAVQALVPTSGPRIRRHGRRFYPYHFLGWCAGALVLSGVLVLLSGQLPPGLGEPVSSLVQDSGTDAPLPWFLRAPMAVLERLGALGWLALLALLLALFALPWIDRTRGEGLARRLPFLVVGLAAAAGWLLLSLGGGS